MKLERNLQVEQPAARQAALWELTGCASVQPGASTLQQVPGLAEQPRKLLSGARAVV